MNKAKKIMIASTVMAILAGSGASGMYKASAEPAAPAAPPASVGPAHHKAAKDTPKRAEAKKRRITESDGNGELCRIGGGAGKPAEATAVSTGENTSVGTATSSNLSEQAAVSVVISGGFDTDPQDHGRPVVLIAAALGVPTEVFREAFRGVTPAGLDSQPSSDLAQRNKAALLKVLAPYGITNERLDEVSDYYRYNGRNGETWKKTRAVATATITNGVVTGITITNPGSGYSSNPIVTVIGPNGTVTAIATVSYTKDFKTNGSISAITIE
jgi:hypothetical protein